MYVPLSSWTRRNVELTNTGVLLLQLRHCRLARSVFYFSVPDLAINNDTATQAAPLIASPTMIVALLSPEVREASTLEVYFSRTLGLALLTLGALTVLLTGSVPLSSSLSEGASPLQPHLQIQHTTY